MSIAREVAQPVGPGFAPYVWAPAIDEVAVRHGVPREAVLKFDQNTPGASRSSAGPARPEHGPPQRVPGRNVPGAP